jgi:hypothetical protein
MTLSARSNAACRTLVLAMLSVAGSCFAQEQAVPTRRILPEDIVQDSVQVFHVSTNYFAVKWTYTEAGANKMLAFNEAHQGQKCRIVVGDFESPLCEDFRPVLQATNYVQWKAGWLKYRTDKFFGVSEDDSKKIVAGLGGRLSATDFVIPGKDIVWKGNHVLHVTKRDGNSLEGVRIVTSSAGTTRTITAYSGTVSEGSEPNSVKLTLYNVRYEDGNQNGTAQEMTMELVK